MVFSHIFVNGVRPKLKALLKSKAFNLGRMMGFEPTASGATIQRSNLLSYIRHIKTTLVIVADFALEEQIVLGRFADCLMDRGVGFFRA